MTPSPAPSAEIRIARAAPVIYSVAVERGTGSFVVRVTGYANPRQVTEAVFTFAGCGSGRLDSTTVTVPLASAFGAWYASSASAAYGSQFLYMQPFTVRGDMAAIGSVTVVLSNDAGNSPATTAPF